MFVFFRQPLTNSLEEAHPDTGTLFASWLSREATEANYIKRETPVMVVLGNPPYSGHSANKGEWIESLLQDYKQEPGGGKLQEKNSKWLNDDYVKFLRYGQYFIEKNGEGILAFINNHSFLDNPTFRGMRWYLLTTFDTIYIIDLHGNSKKKEVCPDGSPDKNVFDIQQGVSINLFVKTGKKKRSDLANVRHFEIYGDREAKYDFLWQHTLGNVPFSELSNAEPFYLFVQQDLKRRTKYEQGFSITDLMPVNVLGFQTHRDQFAITFDRHEIYNRIEELRHDAITDDEYIQKYMLKESRGWVVHAVRKRLLQDSEWEKHVIQCAYRPLDWRYCYFDKVAMDRPRKELQTHVAGRKNLCLNIVRQTKMGFWGHAVISNAPTPAVFVEVKDGSNAFPLYLYPEEGRQQTIGALQNPTPNLDAKIVQQIAAQLSVRFCVEQAAILNSSGNTEEFTPLDLLDYIYAVLHSPSYQETYSEFLKVDFPRIPYPADKNIFWRLVKLGSELRQFHLLESPKVNQYITTYPQDGNNTVSRRITQNDYELHEGQESGRVWINDTQYFDNVPQVAWEFYLGGYQPAQKWLKDRHGRELSFEDILHYQKIIVALIETDRIVKEIEDIDCIG